MHKTKEKFARYEDPTGEFDNRELRQAEWFQRHKVQLQKIGVGVLVAFCIVTVAYSLWGWGSYLIFGYWADRDNADAQAEQAINFAAIHAQTGAADLNILTTDIFQTVEKGYDLVAIVENPNKRHLAYVTYKFSFSDGETTEFQTVLLPGDKRPVGVFGYEIPTYPTDVRLEVVATRWRRINPHVVADPQAYMADRLQFPVTDVSFRGRTDDLPVPQLTFTLTNNTAYSYWQPVFYVALQNSGLTVGYVPLTVDQFRSKEVRPIDIRLLSPRLSVTDVTLFPAINVFDLQAFMEPAQTEPAQ